MLDLPEGLPNWVQVLAFAAFALISGGLAARRFIKTEKTETAGPDLATTLHGVGSALSGLNHQTERILDHLERSERATERLEGKVDLLLQRGPRGGRS